MDLEWPVSTVNLTLFLPSCVPTLLPAAAFEVKSLFPFLVASPIMLPVLLPYHLQPFGHPSINIYEKNKID